MPQHSTTDRVRHASRRWLNKSAEDLSKSERQVLERTLAGQTVSQDTNTSYDKTLTFGERLADQVAAVGGSWGFLIAFGVLLVAWVSSNVLLATHAFDPYPFIFLNLVLSMLAAVQAPIMMMSQNRQAAKDRIDAAQDYQVNLKSEIEISAVQDKLDALRNDDWQTLIALQQEQIGLLRELLAQRSGDRLQE